MPTTVENQNTMEFLLDVPVKLTVELGNCEMTMKDLLQLGIGAVVQLDKGANDPIDIFVNQTLVAVPIVMLYQIGVWLSAIADRGRERSELSLSSGADSESPR